MHFEIIHWRAGLLSSRLLCNIPWNERQAYACGQERGMIRCNGQKNPRLGLMRTSFQWDYHNLGHVPLDWAFITLVLITFPSLGRSWLQCCFSLDPFDRLPNIKSSIWNPLGISRKCVLNLGTTVVSRGLNAFWMLWVWSSPHHQRAIALATYNQFRKEHLKYLRSWRKILFFFFKRILWFDLEMEYKYHACSEEWWVSWMTAASHFPTPGCSLYFGKFGFAGMKIAGVLLVVLF